MHEVLVHLAKHFKQKDPFPALSTISEQQVNPMNVISYRKENEITISLKWKKHMNKNIQPHEHRNDLLSKPEPTTLKS